LAPAGLVADVEAGRLALASCRTVLDPFLRAAVDTMPPLVRRIAGYHLGWTDEHGRPTDANPGKAVRPTLTLLAAEALGGDPEVALPAAAAVELVHNSSLVHDDVIDGDGTRRHRPTAWVVFDVGPALLAGDALLALAQAVLATSGHPAAAEGSRMLCRAAVDLTEGQCADLSFERRSDVSLAECLAMVEAKTAALIGCACALGACFGGGSPDQVVHLSRFGRHLGFAFQLVDDLLGIWGDPGDTGKPVFSDLQSRKKTLPVVAALASGTPAGRELAALLGRDGELSGEELARAAAAVDRAGGRAWTEAQVDVFVTRALQDLDAAKPKGPAAEQLRSVAHVMGRTDR
jgi:geranylgeranyl diphosphate synthase type I